MIDSGGLYGAEQVLMALAGEQQNRGLTPVILSAGSPGEGTKPLEREARDHRLPVIGWRMRAGLNLRAGRRIMAWAYKEGFSLTHSHGYKFNILGALCRRQRPLPAVTTLHGYTSTQPLSRLWLYQKLDVCALQHLDATVLVSDHMATIPGIRRLPPEKRFIIPNGIAESRPHATDLPRDIQAFRRTRRHCFVCIGRLSREKGQDILIRGWASLLQRHPDCGLVLVGGGPERENLAEQARQLGVSDSVYFADYRPNAAKMLPFFDTLVIPSRTEGLPITLLEAMRTRTPVVATAVGGMASALTGQREPKEPTIVPAGCPKELSDAMAFALTNPEHVQRLTDTAEQRFRDHFTLRAMVDRYLDCYRHVVATSPSHPCKR